MANTRQIRSTPNLSPSPMWPSSPMLASAAGNRDNGSSNHRSAALQHHRPSGRTTDSEIYRVGIYGWRKRCLYFFIILITVIIFINLALTIWIFRVLDFNVGGIGNMRITKNGIRVDGLSEFYHPVYFKKIMGFPNSPLVIDSDRSVSINARNSSGHITGRLLVGDNQIQAICDKFEVYNNDEQLLFATDQNEIAVKVDNLRIMGNGGTRFEGSIQTELVRPEPGSALRLESPTHSLYAEAAQDVEVLSRAGDITAKALLDINIGAQNGELRLLSKSVYFEGLQQSDGEGETHYQVCLCRDGRLFLAQNGADCRASKKICKN